MKLSDADRRALVHLLSDRLPQWGSRANVARDAGLADVQLTGSPRAVWGGLVDEAVSTGSLPALLAAAARAGSGDPDLAALSLQAEEGVLDVPEVADPTGWVRGAAVALVVVLLLGVLALALDWMWVRSSIEPVAAPPTTSADVAPATPEPAAAPPTAAPPLAIPEPVAVVPPSNVDEAATPTAATPPSTAADPVPADAAPVPADAATAPGMAPAPAQGAPCATPAGQIVGYAYVGKTSPGAAGSTWTVPRGLNVRADYPRRDNNWNARTTVRCVLPRGASVRLDDAPVAVDGDAFWVPIVGGSVRAP